MTTASISMAYGTQAINFTCKSDMDQYTVADPVRKADPVQFADHLDDFLKKADLDLSHPAVVVADKTRLCGYPQFLPVLLERLIDHGAKADKITLFIAYGTHLPQSDEESRKAYGRAFDDYHWIHHQCEGDHFIPVGKTRRGTRVRLRADIANASCIITFGAISHHYFAGYGGGRKLLFPGLGNKEDIYTNHGLFLDPADRCLASGCRPGQLDGNPLAEDLADYESFRPADMSIHGILDSKGQVCDLLVGEGTDHFRKACAQHAAHCEVATKQQYGLVVASCGGYPKDINFIQSHKTIHHSADFVCDGGRLVVLAECRDGIGSNTFLPWFELGDWDTAFDRLADHYMGNGGTALAMMAKLKRIKISLVTTLEQSIAELIGFESILPRQAQEYIDQHNAPMAVIPNGGMVVKKVSHI